MLSAPPTLTVNPLLADLVSCCLSLPTQWQAGSVAEALVFPFWCLCGFSVNCMGRSCHTSGHSGGDMVVGQVVIGQL